MKFTDVPDTPSGREEVIRLRGYIKALKEAHQKEINSLLAQARQQARQIAELRMEAGHATAATTAAIGGGDPPPMSWSNPIISRGGSRHGN